MDILKKLGFGTMRLPVDENEDINYELIGQNGNVMRLFDEGYSSKKGHQGLYELLKALGE